MGECAADLVGLYHPIPILPMEQRPSQGCPFMWQGPREAEIRDVKPQMNSLFFTRMSPYTTGLRNTRSPKNITSFTQNHSSFSYQSDPSSLTQTPLPDSALTVALHWPPVCLYPCVFPHEASFENVMRSCCQGNQGESLLNAGSRDLRLYCALGSPPCVVASRSAFCSLLSFCSRPRWQMLTPLN